MSETDSDAVKSTESLAVPLAVPVTARPSRTQRVLTVLGVIAFFYFARPVVLPIVLACVAAMTLKPLIRWLSCCHIPPAVSAAAVISILVTGLTMAFSTSASLRWHG
jgi:predicted PurR-regulated permease PerM